MPSMKPSGASGAAKALVVRSEIRHLCPFKDEVDNGHVTVHFEVGADTIELHSLADYFRSFAGERITHEALTDRIFRELSSSTVTVTKVVTRWKTAGMPVKVKRS